MMRGAMLPTIAICTMARNEGAYIEEWVAFHRMLGVTRIRLYDNGSDDRTAEIVERLARDYPIERVVWTHVRNTHDMVQKAAFDDGAAYFVGRSDFVAFIDIDEFLLPQEGTSLPAALERFDASIGAIAVNQRVFGSAGQIHASPDYVIKRFTRRAALDCPEHFFIKSIARPECLLPFPDVHSVRLNTGRYVFPDGTPYEPGDPHAGCARRIVTGGALKLHHYPLKSLEEFRVKQARFSKTDLVRNYDDAYFWNRVAITDVEDDFSAASLAQAVAEAAALPSEAAPTAAVQVARSSATRATGSMLRHLICDVGMSEGNDTQFYLQKGFDVVGVEADPIAAAKLSERFAAEISAGRLSLQNRAAYARGGEMLPFWHNDREQGHSSLNPEHSFGPKQEFQVRSMDWAEVAAVRGVPYFLKLDIQGGEQAFLDSMLGALELPMFISVECQSHMPMLTLLRLGYQKFKLVNQTILDTFHPPIPAREGNYVEHPDWRHASGPFGQETPGHRWLDFREIMVLFDQVWRLRDFPEIMAPSWFDCHACLE